MLVYNLFNNFAKIDPVELPNLSILVHPVVHDYCLNELLLPLIHGMLYGILASEVELIIFLMYSSPVLDLLEGLKLPWNRNGPVDVNIVSKHQKLLLKEIQALLKILCVLVVFRVHLLQLVL